MSNDSRKKRLRTVILIALGMLILVAVWFRGLHPARGLARGEASDITMATNRLQQSLWQTGYAPKDCSAIPPADPQYTCVLVGEAREQVQAAVSRPARSFYVLGQEPVPDPVHIISFKVADGAVYLLAVKSLDEADAGIFYGYRADGRSIASNEIRWFRYTNAELGRVLRQLRRG